MAGGALGLRYLVLVMNRDVVETAGMDIQRLAQVLHRHRRALDMPARVAAAPRAIPLHQMARLLKHPQREIVRALLVGRMLEALAGVLLVEALAREPADPRRAAPLLDVEVNPTGRDVAVTVRDDPLDHADHRGDIVGRPA